MMQTLTQHPLWPLIQPWVRIETYDRDGGHADPRHRIELAAPDNADFRRVVLELTVECAACGRVIHPIRSRNGDPTGHLYVAVTCPLSERFGCARGAAASAEYDRIVAAATATNQLPW